MSFEEGSHLVKIAEEAFKESGIACIKIPNGVSLGDGCFAKCKNLQEVRFNGVTELGGQDIFEGCTRLLSSKDWSWWCYDLDWLENF